MVDPNLDLGLDYTGGINKPTPDQIGFFARVDPSGRNIEYVREYATDYTRKDLLSGALTDVGSLRFVALGNGYALETWVHDGVALRKVNTRAPVQITTTDATVTTALSLPVPSSTAFACQARWHGRAGTVSLFRESSFVVRRVGTATVTQWGSTLDTFAVTKDDATWGTPNLSVASTFLNLQVTGKAATTITWNVELNWREFA